MPASCWPVVVNRGLHSVFMGVRDLVSTATLTTVDSNRWNSSVFAGFAKLLPLLVDLLPDDVFIVSAINEAVDFAIRCAAEESSALHPFTEENVA